jgi:hypothetical protein
MQVTTAAPASATLADALRPAIDAGAIIERATLWPWIVDACWSRTQGIGQRSVSVVQAPMHQPPQAEDHIPADAQLLRADVFPATRFDDMTPTVRVVYRSQYSAFLMWRKAHALGKTVAELQPWTDYDPVTVDEAVQRWINPSVVRFSGD